MVGKLWEAGDEVTSAMHGCGALPAWPTAVWCKQQRVQRQAAGGNSGLRDRSTVGDGHPGDWTPQPRSPHFCWCNHQLEGRTPALTLRQVGSGSAGAQLRVVAKVAPPAGASAGLHALQLIHCFPTSCSVRVGAAEGGAKQGAPRPTCSCGRNSVPIACCCSSPPSAAGQL